MVHQATSTSACSTKQTSKPCKSMHLQAELARGGDDEGVGAVRALYARLPCRQAVNKWRQVGQGLPRASGSVHQHIAPLLQAG